MASLYEVKQNECRNHSIDKNLGTVNCHRWQHPLESVFLSAGDQGGPKFICEVLPNAGHRGLLLLLLPVNRQEVQTYPTSIPNMCILRPAVSWLACLLSTSL